MSSASAELEGSLSKARSKITNRPEMRHGRTAEARRVRDLFVGYSSALGNPVDVPTMALILSAAEDVTIAEAARADHIAGKVDINAVVRAEGTAARALRRIGMNKVATPAPLSLADQLAALGHRPPVTEPPIAFYDEADVDQPGDETTINEAASALCEASV